jgi:hypothetical protein
MEDISNIKLSRDNIKPYLPVIYLAAANIALLFIIIRILLPEVLSVKSKFDQLESDRTVVEVLDNKFITLSEFTEDELLELIKRSQVLIPEGKGIPSLLLALNELENKADVVVTEFGLVNTTAGMASGDIPGVGFRIDAVAEKKNLYEYLLLINNDSRRYIVVDNINFNYSSKPDKGATGFVLRGRAVYLPFIEKIGGVAKELPALAGSQRLVLKQLEKVSIEEPVFILNTENRDSVRRDNPFAP